MLQGTKKAEGALSCFTLDPDGLLMSCSIIDTKETDLPDIHRDTSLERCSESHLIFGQNVLLDISQHTEPPNPM